MHREIRKFQVCIWSSFQINFFKLLIYIMLSTWALVKLQFSEWDIAQVVEHPPGQIWITRSILHGKWFEVWLIFHSNQWSIKGYGMCCTVCGKVLVKDPLLLLKKSILCGDSGFHLMTYVTMTICLMSNSQWYESQCTLEVLLNKTNFPNGDSASQWIIMRGFRI